MSTQRFSSTHLALLSLVGLLALSLLFVGCDTQTALRSEQVAPGEGDQAALNPAGQPVGPSIDVSKPAAASKAAATTWVVGDIFAAIGNGAYSVYDNTGLFKETISDGLGGFTTGCAFNPNLNKLYTTNFSNTKVIVYDDASPHGILQTVDTGVASPNGHSESVVFAANGDFYVGHPDGNDLIHQYDAAGTLLATYSAAVDNRGTDWIDLASDQVTLFYTSEGRAVQRFDVGGNAQLPNFAVLPGGGAAFALRLLPPGDGSGGLLVADLGNVKQLDGTGAVISTYDVTGVDGWFSLNLDPDGVHFWAGSFSNGTFYKFVIEPLPGNYVDTQVTTVNTGSGSFFGLCLKGEPTAGLPDDERRMTGGGSVFDANGIRFTHGFELHCDANQGPNNLQINWGGNRFHLESLGSASCSDDASISEGKPVAGFDTFVGTGVGRLNGTSGVSITFKFTDAGEPGKGVDLAQFTIDALPQVSGTLNKGNHQAHRK